MSRGIWARYGGVLDAVSDGILVVDTEGTIVHANPALTRLLGHEPRDLVGTPVERLVPPPVRAEHRRLREAYLRSPRRRGLAAGSELPGWSREGRRVPLHIALSPLEIGGRRYVIATLREAGGREAETDPHVAAALAGGAEAIVGIDGEGRVTSWSRGAERLYGYPAREMLGRPLIHLIPPDRYGELLRTLEAVRSAPEPVHLETRRVRKDGSLLDVALTVTAVRDGAGAVLAFSEVVHDITRLKNLQARFQRLAFHDALTGLANRRLLEEQGPRLLALADRAGRPAALAYLDLSGFKGIDDRLGHEAGDRLLVGVASRLRETSRETDIVARLGGDEFVVLLSRVDDREAAVAAARRLLGTLERPFDVGDAETEVGAQVGLALYPEHGVDLEGLLRAADEAMYAQKRAGRPGVHLASGRAAPETAGAAERLDVDGRETDPDRPGPERPYPDCTGDPPR